MAADDHHFTIAGTVWHWRYTRLRGQAAGWAYLPDSKNPGMKPRVLIDSRLKGRSRLETELHEGLHCAFPQMSEETITEVGRDLARVLHALGYRLVEPS
jgi:hypothetical protein